MSLARTGVIPFSPAGCADTQDASHAFPGAMTYLKNLIPDPSTQNLWICRPAAIRETAFATFNTPAFISVFKIIGSRVYGMIATARNVGKDEPFCYDLATQAFVAVSGVTNANTPTTQVAAGAWTPPTMDIIGSKIVVTHPGFGSGGKFFGWFDVANPAAPAWDAGNTATNALSAVPSSVRAFSSRAYYIVNLPSQPAVVASDALDPLTVTSITQVLTFDDNKALTALGQLPLDNQLGGVIQALMVFKADNIYQITGDFSTNTLAKNSLNVATGTLAQNSVVSTPKGLAFLSPDGFRVIDFRAKVSDPLGAAGQGIVVPFIYAAQPSRVCAACTGTILRATTQNSKVAGSPFQDWWYDIVRGIWHGPHTFPASFIAAYGTLFIMAPQGVTGSLWRSATVQTTASVFIENGTQMTWEWRPAMLADPKWMAEMAMVETQINLARAFGDAPYLVQALDQDGAVLNSTQFPPVAIGALWGNFNWGQANWNAASQSLTYVPIPWSVPLVFRRLTVSVTGQSTMNVQLGDMYLRYEKLGYSQQVGMFR